MGTLKRKKEITFLENNRDLGGWLEREYLQSELDEYSNLWPNPDPKKIIDSGKSTWDANS